MEYMYSFVIFLYLFVQNKIDKFIVCIDREI